jgi:hypothetical protein
VGGGIGSSLGRLMLERFSVDCINAVGGGIGPGLGCLMLARVCRGCLDIERPTCTSLTRLSASSW